MINPNDFIGKRFGNVTIIKYYGRYRNGYHAFDCRCDCGNEFVAKMYQKGNIRNYCEACCYKVSGEKRAKANTRWFMYDGEIYSTKTYAEKFGVKKRKRKGD